MAESGASLFALAQAQAEQEQAFNPFNALVGGITQGMESDFNNRLKLQEEKRALQQKVLEEQRQQAIKIAEEKRQLDRVKSIMSLFNTAQDTSGINTDLAKAERSVDNRRIGASFVKVPENSMMSLVGGGFGDIDGNPIGVPSSDLDPTQAVFKIAQSQAEPTVEQPTIQSNFGTTFEPDISYDMDKGLKIGFKTVDNTKDLRSLEEEAAKIGIDPTGMDRKTIIKSIAQKKSGSIENLNLTDEQILQGRVLAKELYGARAMEIGLPAIYKEMASGKTVNQIKDAVRFSGDSDKMVGDFRNAAQSILISSPEGVSQKAIGYIDDNLQKGDVEGAKQQLKRLARKEAGTEEARAIGGKERTVQLLDEIQGDLNDLESKGINTNIFSGTAEEISSKIGTINNPELRKVATKIAAAIQSYRKAMSGAAFSIPEAEEYKNLFPSIGRTNNFNSANISALKDVFSGDLDSFYALSMGEKEYNRLFKNIESNQEASGVIKIGRFDVKVE